MTKGPIRGQRWPCLRRMWRGGIVAVAVLCGSCATTRSGSAPAASAEDAAFRFVRAIAAGDAALARSLAADSTPVTWALDWTGDVSDYWGRVAESASVARIDTVPGRPHSVWVRLHVPFAVCSPPERYPSHQLNLTMVQADGIWRVSRWLVPIC